MKKWLLPLVLLLGCSSNPYKEYEQFPIGGTKSDLVETVGSPLRTKRKDSVDIWTYRFYEGDAEIFRDVYIKDGKVIKKTENAEAQEAEIEKKITESLKKK